MVDVLVEPTYGRAVISPVLSLANDYSGDYVVPDDEDAIASVAAAIGGVDVTAGPHNAFAYDPGNSSGLTVRIDTGEAFVGGRYLVSDDTSATRTAVDGSTVPVHDVDLPANATTTVSIGPDDRANSVATDQLIIGPDSAFPAPETPRLPLFDFTTDGSSVTSVTDRRRTGEVIDADSVSPERVFDTSGRYHGKLTGSGDGTVIQNAINNRSTNAGIVVPNPGFPLELDQQIDLPAAEEGFSLATMGYPIFDVANDFTGNHAIAKAAVNNPNRSDVSNYYIGPMFVNCFGANRGNVIDGVRLVDIAQSVVDRFRIRANTGWGIRLGSANLSSTLNKVLYPKLLTTNGNGILLGRSGSRTNLTVVQTPTYSGGTKDDGSGRGIAYRDEGDFNMWLESHCEHARIVHQQIGSKDYAITEGDWDRQTGYTHTVLEKDDAHGRITHRGNPTQFAKLRLCSSATEVNNHGWIKTNAHEVIDLFKRLKRITPADSVASGSSTVGVVDNSDANSSVSYGTAGRRGQLVLQTGATSGDRAVLNQGGPAVGVRASVPKLFVPLDYPSGQDNEFGVVIRIGIYEDADNRCELIYDAGNNLGDHGTANWYFELETGGNLRQRTDTGVGDDGTGSVREYGVQREEEKANASWSAHIGGSKVATGSNGGTGMTGAQARIVVQTFQPSSKTWTMKIGDGMRLWTT